MLNSRNTLFVNLFFIFYPQMQEKSRRNSSNRQKLKVKHTGGQKSFIRILEEKNLMVERLSEKESEEDVEEVADTIFKEVLGQRSGYAVEMGHMVILDPSPTMKSSRAFIHLWEENQWNKSDAEMYKSKLDKMMGDIEALQKIFSEHEIVL
ncbi:hypothetical protein F2P56_018706 [Juglans regia]|uniref:Uncharacterized protein n=1 Tax=Juglans regia TaxID=51240 RepID=A0A833UNT3_JUGRE|nr:hypothetical protein F2P56_018706 [Juglans regia]